MVELLGLKELEPLSGTVSTGLIGFGTSGSDAGVSAVVTGETHRLGLSLDVRVLSRCCIVLLVSVCLGGWLLMEAR